MRRERVRTCAARRGLGGLQLVLPLALALAGSAAACEGPSPGGRRLVVGPLDEFERSVEPVLAARCAQGGCHGRPDRPLSFFSPGVHRADASRTHLDERLTRAEIEANAASLAALAQAAPAEASLALRKPLAAAAGGVYHGGGDVFVDDNDADYRAMLRWLRACASPAPDGGAR